LKRNVLKLLKVFLGAIKFSTDYKCNGHYSRVDITNRKDDPWLVEEKNTIFINFILQIFGNINIYYI
jgi:hypothetical protein